MRPRRVGKRIRTAREGDSVVDAADDTDADAAMGPEDVGREEERETEPKEYGADEDSFSEEAECEEMKEVGVEEGDCCWLGLCCGEDNSEETSLSVVFSFFISFSISVFDESEISVSCFVSCFSFTSLDPSCSEGRGDNVTEDGVVVLEAACEGESSGNFNFWQSILESDGSDDDGSLSFLFVSCFSFSLNFCRIFFFFSSSIFLCFSSRL